MSDRVLVKRDDAEKMSPGGIHIPSQAEERPLEGTVVEGTVVAVGPGNLKNGFWVSMDLVRGSRIMFGKFAGSEIVVGGEKYLLLREDEIYGVLETP